jgi:hypothetical protein
MMTATGGAFRATSLALSAGVMLALCGGCAPDRPPPPGPTAAQPCPAWTSYPADLHSNSDARYLGCANAANLQAMVADKADLKKGAPLGSGDGNRATLAVEAYRQDKVKAFEGAGAMTPGGASSAGAGGGS